MPDVRLRFIVRTPQAIVIERDVLSARVPTGTGQVGLRPRMEPVVLAIEPGLAVLRTPEGVTFVGSAGGLLSCTGREAVLLTPLGVAGEAADAVQQELDRALAAPGAEFKIRATLDRLEGRILAELRRRPGAAAPDRGEP
jgi:F0F1-type ATP synthase epsilon subunit